MFFTYYHGQVLNLNISDVIKNETSLCDLLDIMGEIMCKYLKKSFLKRHSYKAIMRMISRSKSKGAQMFCPAH